MPVVESPLRSGGRRVSKTTTTRIAELEAELADLRRRIRALEFAVECARVLGNQEHILSNLGWFLSIVFGAVGTVVAVTRSQHEDMYVSEVHYLEMELIKLWIDKKLLLQEIDRLQRQGTARRPRADGLGGLPA